MALKINNPEAFAKHIEKQVTTNYMTYMEAIIDFCERRSLDVEVVLPFITDKMKSELEREGVALHLLKKNKLDTALPFAE